MESRYAGQLDSGIAHRMDALHQAFETFACQQRQIAAVINVRMRQSHCIDGVRRHTERLPIPCRSLSKK